MGRGKSIMQRVMSKNRLIIALKILNFGWLFALTYGKYGWDVGEPVAYLTALSVDLVAMLGLFRADDAVENLGQTDYAEYLALGNVESRRRMLEWKLGYLWKKL